MKKRKQKWGYGILLVGLLLSVVYTVLCASVKPDQILPRTTINGIAFGGMTKENAIQTLEEDALSRQKKAVLTISFEGQEYQVDVKAALKYDSEAVVEEALRPCRKNFFLRGAFLLRSLFKGRNLTFMPDVDQELLQKAVKDCGVFEADSRVETSYKAENDQLVIVMGRSGKKADEEKLLKAARKAVTLGDYEKVLLCPSVEVEIEPLDLEQIHEEIYQEAVNATLDPENGYRIIPSITGVDFDMEYVKSKLAQAQEGDTIIIDLLPIAPAISTEDMQKNLFRDVLAEFSTSVGGSENRKINIQIAAEKCREIILNAGAEFSFNDAVGEQTAETGFKKANATLDKQVIQAYGGGICQVSTTIFEAALYAGLDIPERWNHTYISSYADPGMDAAVAWDVLDLKIVNNLEYPVKLQVVYAAGRLTATFLGTRMEDTPIDIETEVLDDVGNLLKVITYRKTYSSDRSQLFVEEIAYSEYLNSSKRVD